jgi:hypothetical protein
MRRLVMLAATAGCGRVGFQPVASGDCPTSFAADMVAYWPLDEPAGATAFADASGQGHDLTCNPCPTAGLPGVRGSAAAFHNGSAKVGDSLNTLSAGSLATLVQLTLAAWVNLQEHSAYAWILSNDRDCTGCGGPYRGYSLFASYGMVPGFQLWDGNLDFIYRVNGSMLPLAEWHFVTGTYDGAMLRLYLDGALVAEQPNTAGFRNPPTFDTRLGAMGLDPTLGLTGMLDEVIILDRAASVDEIAALMRGCR